MADETWLETLETWSEYVSEYVYGPSPTEVLRRATSSLRTAVFKLERERKKTAMQEKSLIADAKAAAPHAHSFADVRPALLAVANARRSIVRIDKMTIKLKRLQQQMIETEAQSTMTSVLTSVTAALAQASAMTGGVVGVRRMLQGYEKQQALMEMTQDAFADLEEEEEDESNADEMLSQIAAEAELHLKFDLPLPSMASQKSDDEVDYANLMERLQRLTSAASHGGGGDDRGPAPGPAAAPA
jgi:hypothetical protein